jgi:hypothetical protein
MLWHPDGRRVNFGLATGNNAEHTLQSRRVTRRATGDLSLWMDPAYNFETIFNFSASLVRSMSFSHNQWWLLMGDDEGTLRYLHSYDEIMKGKG